MPTKKKVVRVRPNWSIHPDVVKMVQVYAENMGLNSVSNTAEHLLRTHPSLAATAAKK